MVNVEGEAKRKGIVRHALTDVNDRSHAVALQHSALIAVSVKGHLQANAIGYLQAGVDDV